MPKKGKSSISARARHGGKRQKAGTKNKKKEEERRAREAAGTSRFLTLGMRKEDVPVPDSVPDPEPTPEELARRARRTEQNRINKQKQRERDARLKAEMLAQRADLADMAEGKKEDTIQIKSIWRRHQRNAAKLRALILQIGSQYGADDVAEAIRLVSKDPEVKDALAAGGLSDNGGVNEIMLDNLAVALHELKGRKDDDAQRFISTLLKALQSGETPKKQGAARKRKQAGQDVADAPAADAAESSPAATPADAKPFVSRMVTPSEIARRFKLCLSTVCRHAAAARADRRSLLENKECKALWVDMKKRAGPLKVTAEVVETVHEYLTHHPSCRVSPSPKDTLLVRGPDGKRNIRVPRVLTEVSRTRLFQQFREAHPLIHIRERTFRSLFPKNFRRLTKRQESCGCARCIEFHGLHATALRMRRELKTRHFSFNYEPYDHPKASDAVFCLLCPEAESSSGEKLGVPPAACWMGRCDKCGIGKTFKTQQPEMDKGPNALTVKMTTFEYVADPCPHKPDRKSQKRITRRVTAGEFMDEYLKKLKEYAYHLCLMRTLDRCRRAREAGIEPGDALDLRDFAEKLSAEFEGAPQHDHWQNVTCTIETAVVTAFDKTHVDALARGATPSAARREATRAADAAADAAVGELAKDHHYFFISDYKKQDAAVVHRNMDELITRLRERGLLKDTGTLWQLTDGCGAQYWCSRAVHLLQKLAKKHKITIDRMRSAPGHGKSKADGAHAVLKVYVRSVMAMETAGLPDDRKVSCMHLLHTAPLGGHHSVAQQAAGRSARTRAIA